MTASTTVPRRNDTNAAWNVPTALPRPELIGAWRAIRPPTNAVRRTAAPRSTLLRVQPVRADARVHGERRVDVRRAHHLRAHDLRRALRLLGRPLEEQLVVDLEDAARLQPGAAQRVVGAHHRHLDDVGRGALDDRVDREALAQLARLPVAGADLGDLPAAAEQRRDVAVLLGLGDRVGHEPRDRGEALEVAVDELLGLLLLDLQAVGQAVRREAVDDAVVDHLRLRAHADRELVRRRVEHRGGGLGVHVLAALEDVLEDLLAGDVGEHAQLDLRVVDGDQDVVRLRDEARADLAPRLRADGDVLEVRV